MKLNTLSAALLCALPMTGAFAAALDRSGQSISSFLQPDNYFEVGVSALMPEVTGKETADFGGNKKIDNMAKDYVFANAAVKLQFNDKFSFGLIFDQPFGASAAYGGDNFFVSNAADSVLPKGSLDAMAANKINDTVTDLMSATDILDMDKYQAVKNYPSIQELAATQAGIRLLIGDVNSGGIKTALQKFADDKSIPGGLATAQAMYNNIGGSGDLGGGVMLKDVIDAAVYQQVTTGVTKTVKDKVDGNIEGVNKALGKGATNVSVTTENISMLFGYSPIDRVTVYAGPVYQNVKGHVSLRGEVYSLYNGYDLDIDDVGGMGWIAGAAYQIPEIALKASLTYRSEIDHKASASDVTETISALNGLTLLTPTEEQGAAIANDIVNSKGKTTITTPQSVNLDLQSGIMADTVAFANIRWVNWKDFAIRPDKFGKLSQEIGGIVGKPNGFNLVEYSEDQWSVTAGVGRKFSEKWAGNVSVGWDSGAGNPVSTLGPTDGFYNVGLGVQFSPAANYFVAGGVKYLWLGDAKAQTGAQGGTSEYIAKFEDNNAVAVGLKMGYRF